MKLSDLKLITENIDIDAYLNFYTVVRKNMEHPEWLGTFTKEEIIDILNDNGKIFIYYKENEIVCSFMYMPVTDKVLKKHSINLDEKLVGACGPIMVNPKYVGNKLQAQMLDVLDNYCLAQNNNYVFTKFSPENVYSKNNFIKNGYNYIETYTSSAGDKKDIYLKK